MSFQSCIHHLSDIIEGVVDVDWKRDWSSLLGVGIGTILTGPLVLLGFGIQRWNVTNTPWDAKAHWNGTRQFAVTFAIIDALLVVAYISFRAQLVTPGKVITYSILLWYLGCTLLSPALALLVEKVDPRTMKAKRIRMPSEIVPSLPQPSPLVVSAEPLEVPTVSQPKRPPKQQKRSPSSVPKKKQETRPPSTSVDIRPFKKDAPVRFEPSHLPMEDTPDLPQIVEEPVSSESPLPRVEPTVPSSERLPKREKRKPEPLDQIF